MDKKSKAANDDTHEAEADASTPEKQWEEITLKAIDKGRFERQVQEHIATAARTLLRFVEKHKKIKKARAKVKVAVTLGWDVEHGYSVIGESELNTPREPAKADFLAPIELSGGTPTLTVGDPGDQGELPFEVDKETGEIKEDE